MKVTNITNAYKNGCSNIEDTMDLLVYYHCHPQVSTYSERYFQSFFVDLEQDIAFNQGRLKIYRTSLI